MRKKHKTARISVTLPIEMLQDFKLRSEKTGLSISRLIYLQLRSRTPMILITSDVLSEIVDMNKRLEKIITGKCLSAEELSVLRERIEQIKRIVDFDSPAEIIHVRKRR